MASVVWDALGYCGVYIEPFFGSGAVLLNRPNYDATKMSEIINDSDGFVANVWRALQSDPDAVAKRCDWPVNHADLIARKAALLRNEKYLLKNLCKDEKWFDAELAGYWIWAASCWIGTGLTRPGQIPHVSDTGKGVHAIGQIPHVGNTGMGVHVINQIPQVSNTVLGVQDPYNENIYKWFRELSERLRNVRVVCGDWSRVCGGNWQLRFGTCGIFFDPPYGVDDRDTDIYHKDSIDVAKSVLEWALKRGEKNEYRIVIAGYEEHENLLKHGWTSKIWTATGGYANTGKGHTEGSKNRKRETLYFSPHCVKTELF